MVTHDSCLKWKTSSSLLSSTHLFLRLQFGPHNHGPYTVPVVAELIKHGRTLRLQSFNQYRKRFDMKPYKSFEALTGKYNVTCMLNDNKK